jgi:hypothetical protein
MKYVDSGVLLVGYVSSIVLLVGCKKMYALGKFSRVLKKYRLGLKEPRGYETLRRAHLHTSSYVRPGSSPVWPYAIQHYAAGQSLQSIGAASQEAGTRRGQHH